ncbi:hypothetical protein SGPA1_10367 [Streptomyces misionensis JCM 4497]
MLEGAARRPGVRRDLAHPGRLHPVAPDELRRAEHHPLARAPLPLAHSRPPFLAPSGLARSCPVSLGVNSMTAVITPATMTTVIVGSRCEGRPPCTSVSSVSE